MRREAYGFGSGVSSLNDDHKLALTIGAILVAVALLTVFLVTYRQETNAHVVELSWSRSIDIQEYKTVQESDWNVPANGRQTRSYSAFHHYNRVVTGSHQSCSGTGNQRVCTTVYDYTNYPVYQTKYDYDIDRWVTIRTPEQHGIGTEAAWPDVSDLRDGDGLGAQRAGTRYSRYTVAFSGDHSLDMTEERWRAFKPGQRVTLVLNFFKQALDVR